MNNLVTDGSTKPFNPADIMEGVRARVRATFVELIPEDAWKAMIEKEVNDFMKPSSTWNNDNRASSFSKVVREVCEQRARKAVGDLLEGPEWNGSQWGAAASAAVLEFMEKNTENFISAWMSKVVQEQVYTAFQNLRNGR